MFSHLLRLTLVVAILTTALNASAIIRRHDRDDAKYLELGAKYPARNSGDSRHCEVADVHRAPASNRLNVRSWGGLELGNEIGNFALRLNESFDFLRAADAAQCCVQS